MTLTDIVRAWIDERWPGFFNIETNTLGHLHVFTWQKPTMFIMKVYDSHVDLADQRWESRCVCCAVKHKIMAADPQLFNKLEESINAFQSRRSS